MDRFNHAASRPMADDNTTKRPTSRITRLPGLPADAAGCRTLIGCLLIVSGLALAVMHWFGHAGGFSMAVDATWRDYAASYAPAVALIAAGWWTLPTD